MTGFAELPPSAAWRHVGSREGFEVAYLSRNGDGITLAGTSLGVEQGVPWSVDYTIDLDAEWITRQATVSSRSAGVQRTVSLHSAGPGSWLIDGRPAPWLAGCFDVDLDVSALTNALPLHRMRLDLAGIRGNLDDPAVPASAAYVQAADLQVARLDQTYRRRAGTSMLVFDYTAPSFSFRTDITYDHSGLVLDYPGIAVRAL